jgi:Domain of unknown function (DUF4432)
VVPYGDDQGNTLAVLHNAAGNLGVSVAFNVEQLPVFSLWKNTDTPVQGYVTGLEPGTSFAYNRSYQSALNRVPTIGAKEQRHFDITYTLLADASTVDKAAATSPDHLPRSTNGSTQYSLGRSAEKLATNHPRKIRLSSPIPSAGYI